jgi:hypothetical protein
MNPLNHPDESGGARSLPCRASAGDPHNLAIKHDGRPELRRHENAQRETDAHPAKDEPCKIK